ncbi:MAG: hypothetical protein WCQ96_01115 [Patescibacteria group bacterium]
MLSVYAFLEFLVFVTMIIGLIRPSIFEKSFKHGATRPKIFLAFIFILFLFSVLESVSSEDINSNQTQSTISTSAVGISTNYEIVKEEDLSRKAMGDKNLSDFSASELAALPTNKKIKYQIVVPSTIKENQVDSTVNKIISDIISKDSGIDEIILFLYSDKELAISDGAYDVATAVWAPLGDLGNVTPVIAVGNDRTSYTITVDKRDDLDEYLSQRGKEETLYGLTEQQRRQLYKEIVAAEDKARQEANRLFPTNYESNDAKFSELREKYVSAIRTKYNINTDQEKSITNEGLKEGWPLD